VIEITSIHSSRQVSHNREFTSQHESHNNRQMNDSNVVTIQREVNFRDNSSLIEKHIGHAQYKHQYGTLHQMGIHKLGIHKLGIHQLGHLSTGHPSEGR
jgi:hypothetical protein